MHCGDLGAVCGLALCPADGVCVALLERRRMSALTFAVLSLSSAERLAVHSCDPAALIPPRHSLVSACANRSISLGETKAMRRKLLFGGSSYSGIWAQWNEAEMALLQKSSRLREVAVGGAAVLRALRANEQMVRRLGEEALGGRGAGGDKKMAADRAVAVSRGGALFVAWEQSAQLLRFSVNGRLVASAPTEFSVRVLRLFPGTDLVAVAGKAPYILVYDFGFFCLGPLQKLAEFTFLKGFSCELNRVWLN